MPTYLWQGSYSPDGAKGLSKDGGSKRRASIKQTVEAAGGKLHAFYFAIGQDDVIGIAEFPDQATATAVSVAVRATGMVSIRTTVLLTPEEMDAATKKAIGYKPPGSA